MGISSDKMFDGVNSNIKSRQEKYTTDEYVSALGEVAASVAHEIRNPLAGIKGFGQLLQNQLKPGDIKLEYIETILEETKKIENFIEEYMTLFRPTFPQKSSIVITKIIDEVLPMLAYEAVENCVSIDIHCEDTIPVHLDVNQIKIMFLNLGRFLIRDIGMNRVLLIRVKQNQDTDCLEIIFCDSEEGNALEQDDKVVFHLNSRQDCFYLNVIKRIVQNHMGVLKLYYSRKGTLCKTVVKLPV